jgi:hypothetical protein
LKGNSIIAAFEVEKTTSIYSGLLRMSDLLALQPNLNIKLYLLAPEDRRNKVEQEILRPTFQLKEKPLSQICGFISISELMLPSDCPLIPILLSLPTKPERIYPEAAMLIKTQVKKNSALPPVLSMARGIV